MMPIIQAKNLSKYYKLPASPDNEDATIKLFENLSISIEKGDIISVSGASGSGKSTLISLLAGLEQPDSGDIVINGQVLGRMDQDQRADMRLKNIGFIFQSFNLLDNLTALDNILLPMDLLDASGARELALHLAGRVGISERLSHYPEQLSGGEQQRVAIARAFITRPCIIFADEPTGNLDVDNAAKIKELLFQINREQGTTLIIVTHDQQLALQCNRQYRIKDGALTQLNQHHAAAEKTADSLSMK